MSTTAALLAYQQQEEAPYGRAKNQCAKCGVFRLDGAEPTIHRFECTAGPDGTALAPVVEAPTAVSLNPRKRDSAVKTALNKTRR
jgi:hypothetical protein